jgi:hypothetical protein
MDRRGNRILAFLNINTPHVSINKEKTGNMEFNWPTGVSEIVSDVSKKDWLLEEKVDEIIRRILDRGMPNNPGLDDERMHSKAEREEQKQWEKKQGENAQALEWAKRQYFRLLLLDLQKHKHFVDHEYCEPAPLDEESRRESKKPRIKPLS